MPCPYAEKKGPIVYCKLTGKKVNPLAFPCLTNKYTKCKYYRKASEEKQAEKKVEKEEKQPAPPETQIPAPLRPAPSPQPSTSTKPAEAPVRAETKGMTLDGRRPSNCLECIYYGAKTHTCLLLGITVKDPYDPPCAKTQ
ncbi:MAG: hypothetical protein F7C33_01245 [Desulfurococcales archaeon]|nr:hypothetical protein [Desulfurococcales archaeon]